jgi:hypothetical protein
VNVSTNGDPTAYSTATEIGNITVQPVEVVLFISTVGDVSLSGAPGLDSWDAGDALGFGDPNLAFEPGTTTGTLYSLFDLSQFEVDGDPVSIDAIHQVGSNITVGGGVDTIDLCEGDLLLAVKNHNNDFEGSDIVTISPSKKDLFVFRPDAPGDYSSGTFFILLDGIATNFLTGISLVEQDTLVGDVTVQRGTFLLNAGNSLDILHFDPTGVGIGTTAGTLTTLISGGDIALGNNTAKISGIDLVEADITLGDATLQDRCWHDLRERLHVHRRRGHQLRYAQRGSGRIEPARPDRGDQHRSDHRVA